MLGRSEELKDRVEARRHQLLSKYNELKADVRQEASDARKRLKARLDELEDTLKTGWTNMSDAAKARLNQWLDRDD
jgi:F0F1-type ATP synthase membrane subunit b/b'